MKPVPTVKKMQILIRVIFLYSCVVAGIWSSRNNYEKLEEPLLAPKLTRHEIKVAECEREKEKYVQKYLRPLEEM